jgi:hypothetical protein
MYTTHTKRVVTWQSPSGRTCNVTRQQEKTMRKAGFWPRDSYGDEFCAVSHGLHVGQPTWTNTQLAAMIAQIIGL